jgi:hypothetical protein
MGQATPKILFWLRSTYFGLNAKLEKDFRKHFEGTGYEVEAYHYADLSLLYQVLHSADYAGVYWVSHGADSRTDSPIASGGIFDYRTFDVSPLLKEIHPNLQVLSLISCHSKGTIDQLRKQRQLSITNPGLELLTYTDKIDAEEGLLGALTSGDTYLKAREADSPAGRCAEERRGFFVSVTRKCVRSGPSLFLRSNGNIFGVLPSCVAGETQPVSGYLELTPGDLDDLAQGAFDTGTLDITASSGAQPVDRVMTAPEPYFGEISIQHPGTHSGDFEWQTLQLSEGKALGVDRRIFAFQGAAAPQITSVSSYHPFFCH